jgi:hypothetical protein
LRGVAVDRGEGKTLYETEDQSSEDSEDSDD